MNTILFLNHASTSLSRISSEVSELFASDSHGPMGIIVTSCPGLRSLLWQHDSYTLLEQPIHAG